MLKYGKVSIAALSGVIIFFAGMKAISRAEIPMWGGAAVGSVHLPAGAAPAGDFLIIQFSDRLPVPSPLTKAPVPGCSSVATIQLHSGQEALIKPAELNFSCRQLPPNAAVYGWINGQWNKIESTRNSHGNVSASFTQLTTYAIFVPQPVEILTRAPQI